MKSNQNVQEVVLSQSFSNLFQCGFLVRQDRGNRASTILPCELLSIEQNFTHMEMTSIRRETDSVTVFNVIGRVSLFSENTFSSCIVVLTWNFMSGCASFC